MNSSKASQFGSPNNMIWEYFACLREIVGQVQNAQDDKETRRKVLPCVFISITIVETFLNIYFRILAEESDCSSCREQTIKELDERVSLDRKIKTWPKRFSNKEIDFSQGIGQRFMKIKDLRNKLVHFKSSHETVNLPGIELRGMVDISSYESLDSNVASEALTVAEEMIEEIFRLKGMNNDQIGHALHSWTGKVYTGALNG